MARILPEQAGGKNVVAFLDTIAHSELGEYILNHSDNGYNVLVGSLPGHIHTFDSYSRHPRKLVQLSNLGIKSSAAGRYQFIWPTWHGLIEKCRFRSFEPIDQDRGCVAEILGADALDDVKEGRFSRAVEKCRHIWASLPGAGYGQHENKLEDLQAVYVKAGGTIKE